MKTANELHKRFMPNQHHTIDVKFDDKSLLCFVQVTDDRFIEVVELELPLDEWKELVAFCTLNDHRSVLGLIEKRFHNRLIHQRTRKAA